MVICMSYRGTPYQDDDQGGTTAQFQAFVRQQEDGSATQTWETNASRSRSKAWTVGIAVAVVVAIAIIAVLVFAL